MRAEWVRMCLVGIGVIGLLFAATQAAPAEREALTPRVFIPLALRKAQAEKPMVMPFGASDGYVTKLAFSQVAMDRFLEAGGVYNRMSVSWHEIEPVNTTPDNYVWSKADNLINPLLERGIQPFVLILSNPSWAANTPCGPVYEVDELAEFVGALAARFPTVEYWGLYNEADGDTYAEDQGHSGGCFGGQDLDHNGNPDYADYAVMLHASWKAIRAANPKARLSLGQIAYDNFSPQTAPPWYTGGCCFNYHFLDNLMQYFAEHPLPTGEKYADVLGFNDYLAYNDHVWQPRHDEVGVGAKAAEIRGIMQAHGQTMPLAISEMSGGSTQTVGGITREVQARQVAQMLVQGYYYQIRPLVWWTFDDFGDDCNFNPNCANWKFGIVDHNLVPKPSFETFHTVEQELKGWKPKAVLNDWDMVRFTFKRGGFQKFVYYAKLDSVSKNFIAKTLLVTDMYGNKTLYRHTGDQKIKLTFGRDPIYVEVNP